MVYKCKMCGGDVLPIGETNVGKCEYCKSTMTLPNSDNEKIVNLYNRANDLRINNDFDKAYEIYENILSIDNKQIEAHWGLLLCKYGVEYVDDPKTKKKIPTCHRTINESIMVDSNLKIIKKESYGEALDLYINEANAINEIQLGILSISSKEKPYDIFICYKETDKNGDRTKDSVIAQDIYDKLIEKKYKVFFARVTLENKLGTQYEPYIYSALRSSKVMLVVGTKEENFNAVWVKNEWSRYLEMMKYDKAKSLIPVFSSIDAYKLPEDFAMLQAQSMDKVGAMQDLVRGVVKLVDEYKIEAVDGVDSETIAKVKAVLDDARAIGNGKYEVTIVKETLPVWYYVTIIIFMGIVAIGYLSCFGVSMLSFLRNSREQYTLIKVAKEVNVFALISFCVSALCIEFGLAFSILNRKIFKYKNMLIDAGYVSAIITLLLLVRYCYFPVVNIYYRYPIYIFVMIFIPSLIARFIKPKWKINVSDKTIMNEEDKNKQLELNKNLKDNFLLYEKVYFIKRYYFISAIIIVILLIVALFSYWGKINSSNRLNESVDQIKILSTKYILSRASDYANYKGYVNPGDYYTIQDIVISGRSKYLKITTNKMVSGYIKHDGNVAVICSENSEECGKNFIQTNKRNQMYNQISIEVEYINIRKKDSVNSDIIGQVYKNEIYTVLNKIEHYGNTWYNIETNNGINGWIAGIYNGEIMINVLE